MLVAVLSSLLQDTYLLTPWSRVLLEKLASLQLVKKFPVLLQDTLQSKPLLLPACSLKCFVVLKTCHHHSSQFKSSSTRGKV